MISNNFSIFVFSAFIIRRQSQLESKIPREYCAIQCTADGNCLYNAVSTTLSGNEDNASILRVAALHHAVLHYDHYVKMVNYNTHTSLGIM